MASENDKSGDTLMAEKMDSLNNKIGDVHTALAIQNTAFTRHEVQQTKDFEHIDDCIHRVSNEADGRANSLDAKLEELKGDIAELKSIVYKLSGGGLVLVFLFNNWSGISKIMGG